jgi:bifunctional UDP-N-acetylglucosamine pyrophosphorylase/glucosamine-1-phosphate N-acetyltransferase
MAAADLRICYEWMKRGVLIRDPASTFIDPTVRLGKGCQVEPFTFLQGKTTVGRNCVLGPFARVRDCRIGDLVSIEQSVVEGSVLRKGCKVGPWTRVRPGCDVGAGAHLGNFCEFKKAKIGPGVKAGHLSYLGDAVVGQGANIGAGTITANYDGRNKHVTRIGKKAFIGSGTVLVAPLKVGDEAMTGAGAVVLKGRHVPRRGLALGLPARNIKPTRGRKA